MMEQLSKDRLDKDYSKQWTVFHFDLEVLMLKAHFGWFDTSFNEMLCILAQQDFSISPSNVGSSSVLAFKI